MTRNMMLYRIAEAFYVESHSSSKHKDEEVYETLLERGILDQFWGNLTQEEKKYLNTDNRAAADVRVSPDMVVEVTLKQVLEVLKNMDSSKTTFEEDDGA